VIANNPFNLDLSKTYMVGDRLSDIQAGKRAGYQDYPGKDGQRERRGSGSRPYGAHVTRGRQVPCG